MSIERVGHVVLKMRDLEAAKRFYGGALGMRVSSESPRAVFFRFGEYHHDIGVFKVSEQADSPKDDQVGLGHVALVVNSLETLGQLHKQLTERGVPIEATIDHGMTLSLYIMDPDGNVIEVYCEVPEYNWRAQNDFTKHRERLDIKAALSRSAHRNSGAALPQARRL